MEFPDFEQFTSTFENNENNENEQNTENANPFGNIDMNTILKIKQIVEKMNTTGKNDPRSNLLLSLKPYLKTSKRQKVDQYIQLMNMGSIMEGFNKTGGENIK